MTHPLRHFWTILVATAILAPVRAAEREVDDDADVCGPRDLALTCHSDFDDADHPYRLYLPSAYDGKQAVPLLVALHGTGGNQDKYFDHPTYGDGIYKREAEKRGIAILCPSEGDPLGRPTEWRGVGELHVLKSLEDVCRRFQIDQDRIVLTGQSMGGTGTTYLCCRYPDLFAAGIPLASTYGHLTLLENLRHVPMFYVQGADDWPIYAQDGPIRIVGRLEQLGYDAQLWMVPDVGHNTMEITTPQVLDWALQQHLVKHPQRVTHRAYLPIHGRAYWAEISALDEIGPYAEIDAEVTTTSDILLQSLRNVRQFILRPDEKLLDCSQEIHIHFAGENPAEPLTVQCDGDQQVRLDRSDEGIWKATLEPRQARSYANFRTHKIGRVVASPTADGKAETPLGNWTTDAMRDALGTDIAIATGRHYRGLPIASEQDVYLFDLLNLLRPSNRVLVSFKIDGAGLLEILEDNIRQENSFDGEFLVQVSGCRYAFDRSRPVGERIVESDIDPQRTYSVACLEGLLSRGDMLHLAGRFGKIEYEERELTNITAAWRYIDKLNGIIDAQLDGRVRDVTDK
jgi:predicted esterase